MPLASLLIAPLFVAVQIGLDPSVRPPDAIPPELREQRERAASRQEQDADTLPTTRSPRDVRLSECLTLVMNEPEAGLEYAREWRATARGEDRVRAGHCEGVALARLTRFGEAQAVFLAARDAAAGGDPAYRARIGAMAGHSAISLGEPAGAIPTFERAVADAREARDMELAGSLEIDLAQASMMNGDAASARAALTRAREAAPGNSRGWLLSATLARRSDDLAGAQRFIERAAMLDDRDPAIGLEAGVIAALSGREAAARASFRSVVEAAAGSREAEQARRYLEQLGPSDPLE